MPVRALLDANIFISYLLGPDAQGTIQRVVAAAFSGRFTILVSEGLLDELRNNVASKSYLADRLSLEDLEVLAGALQDVSETIPAIRSAIPAVCRDPKDDYLLAYAVVGQADYLVTGDHDLLALGEVEQLKIVSPADFLEILSEGAQQHYLANRSSGDPPEAPDGNLLIRSRPPA